MNLEISNASLTKASVIKMRPYLWRFFIIYLVSYAVLFGGGLLMTTNGKPILTDLTIIAILMSTVPYYICDLITKKEKRFLNSQERRVFINWSSLWAFIINYSIMFLTVSYIFLVKILLTEVEKNELIQLNELGGSFVGKMLQASNLENFLFYAGCFIFYALFTFFLIRLSVKRFGKKYEKENDRKEKEGVNSCGERT